jgi:hypothetical protein
MSTSLIQITVVIIKATATLPSTNAAFAGTSVVVTDSTGVAQKAVVLTGVETPTPWGFTTSVAAGAGTITATDLDSTGAVIGTPVTQTFTEVGSPPPATFPQTTAITVTPV